MMPAMSGIQDLSAGEVAAQYSAGGLSPVEVVKACLERTAACEPKLNAMYRIDREGSLAAARASETRWRAKQPLSPLDGVGPRDIGLDRLLARATDGVVQEVILATNFTNEG